MTQEEKELQNKLKNINSASLYMKETYCNFIYQGSMYTAFITNVSENGKYDINIDFMNQQKTASDIRPSHLQPYEPLGFYEETGQFFYKKDGILNSKIKNEHVSLYNFIQKKMQEYGIDLSVLKDLESLIAEHKKSERSKILEKQKNKGKNPNEISKETKNEGEKINKNNYIIHSKNKIK